MKLVELGIPQEPAERYTQLVRRDTTLIVVQAGEQSTSDVKSVLSRMNAQHVDVF
ncbi:MAG: hypothetical protein KatS3mg057_1419 [Herpetosiphonaceae bacterium]|nr:MAG: hypothetical protein KatS3mg057_1419 [Herpetosiphonaceae bacterium]